MPYSFTQIEKEKSNTIYIVLCLLVVVYFVFSLLAYLLVKNFLNFYVMTEFLRNSQRPLAFEFINFIEFMCILMFATIIGCFHWLSSVDNLVPRLKQMLFAKDLDPKDSYHQKFQNILDEVSVAIGGKKIEGLVIPTMAMNAFALQDFEGRAAIGVTEGLLARLSRAQIEAVVGHEAAHIVMEDCLSTTVISSIMQIFGDPAKDVNALTDGLSYRSGGFRVRGRGGGYVILFWYLFCFLRWIMRSISNLLRLFISRQREYRADAVAVRLTRDPVSLAEALHKISSRWRGANLNAQNFEAIFIVNPLYRSIDESTSIASDLLATHPPVNARLSVLLDMAHMDMDTLVQSLKKSPDKARRIVQDVSLVSSSKWLIFNQNVWHGPYNVDQVVSLDWIRPDTLIKKLGDEKLSQAFKVPEVRHIFNKENTSSGNGLSCPICAVMLNKTDYEGVEIFKCNVCKGVLLGTDEVEKILIREDFGFSERIHNIADKIKKENNEGWVEKKEDKQLNRENGLQCPKCKHQKERMRRTFYRGFRVELDQCKWCGLLWFDKDELEILQCVFEKGSFV